MNIDTEEQVPNKIEAEFLSVFTELRAECLDKLLKPETTPNLAVAIIRDFNRIWNKKAEKDLCLKKDGFKKVMKRLFLGVEVRWPEEYKKAFRYL